MHITTVFSIFYLFFLLVMLMLLGNRKTKTKIIIVFIIILVTACCYELLLRTLYENIAILFLITLFTTVFFRENIANENLKFLVTATIISITIYLSFDILTTKDYYEVYKKDNFYYKFTTRSVVTKEEWDHLYELTKERWGEEEDQNKNGVSKENWDSYYEMIGEENRISKEEWDLYCKPELKPYTGKVKGYYNSYRVVSKSRGGRESFRVYDLKFLGKIVNGKKEGVWRVYNEDGSLKIKGKYVNNKKEGIWTKYEGGGKIKEKYKAGKKIKEYLIGNLTDVGEYDEEGDKEGIWKEYYRKGKIKSIGNYYIGEKVGNWKEYYENGNLKYLEEYDENGDKEGKQVEYYENGKRKCSENYKGGKSELQIFYNSNDQISKIETLSERIEFYYENKQLKEIKKLANLAFGTPEKIWKYEYNNGKLISIKSDKEMWKYYYKNNKLDYVIKFSGEKELIKWEYIYNEKNRMKYVIEYQNGEQIREIEYYYEKDKLDHIIETKEDEEIYSKVYDGLRIPFYQDGLDQEILKYYYDGKIDIKEKIIFYKKESIKKIKNLKKKLPDNYPLYWTNSKEVYITYYCNLENL